MNHIYFKLIKNLVLFIPLFIISTVVSLLSYPLGPIIALFSLTNKEGNVPKVFTPWLTHDNPIDGDQWHLERWPGDTTFIKFKRRTAWLWRNKGYWFDYYYLGRPIGKCLINHGNPNTSDQGCEGVLFQYNENGIWEFYLIYRYPFKKDKCLRIRLGWKLDDTVIGSDKMMMIATSIGIWKSFEEKK